MNFVNWLATQWTLLLWLARLRSLHQLKLGDMETETSTTVYVSQWNKQVEKFFFCFFFYLCCLFNALFELCTVTSVWKCLVRHTHIAQITFVLLYRWSSFVWMVLMVSFMYGWAESAGTMTPLSPGLHIKKRKKNKILSLCLLTILTGAST